MTSITVFTISGKSQRFIVNKKTLISNIKDQILQEHKYFNILSVNEHLNNDYKLLYKGIELDDSKSLEDYNIIDDSVLQIINKSKPLTMPARKLCESLPNMSVFENYMPSPLDTMSKSNSPHNTSFIEIENKKIQLQLTDMHNLLENILEKINHIEKHLNI